MNRTLRATQIVGFWGILLSASLGAQVNIPEELAPDLIIHNAKIVTMSDASLNASPGRIVEAMAVRKDQIHFIGSNQEVLRLAGQQTRKIDLKGRTVVPGFINGHTHLHNGAVSSYFQKHPEKISSIVKRVNVAGRTYEDLTRGIEVAIKENMAHMMPGQWGFVTVPSNGVGGAGPEIGAYYVSRRGMTEERLTDLAPGFPVLLKAQTSGGWIVNEAGREELIKFYMIDPDQQGDAITESTTDYTAFERAFLGEKYFERHMGELADLLEEALRMQAAAGFTTYSSHLQGMMFQTAFQKLDREERMPIRLGFAHIACREFNANMADCYRRLGDWAGMGTKYFWSVGSTLSAVDYAFPRICTTAEPRPQYKGVLEQLCMVEPGSPWYDAIYAMFRSRIRYVVNHSWSDKGLDNIMDIMERVMEENPDITLDVMRSLRVTADHCALYPRPDQLPRMKKLGIMLSCSPNNIRGTAPWLKVLGEDKAEWVAPIKNILDAGVMPSFEGEGGSLRPGDTEGVTPMANLNLLMTRKAQTGLIVAPNQAIDRVSAIKTATIWGSHYVLKEKELGSLEPGKLADFVVFNKDYFTIPQDEIPTVFPLMTVLGGKTMMLRTELARELGVPAVGPQIEWKFEPAFNPAFSEDVKPTVEGM